jgi:hypothetical protein
MQSSDPDNYSIGKMNITTTYTIRPATPADAAIIAQSGVTHSLFIEQTIKVTLALEEQEMCHSLR